MGSLQAALSNPRPWRSRRLPGGAAAAGEVLLDVHHVRDAAASNWLPAPNGPFWVVLRTYGPDQPILSKSWQAPAITEIG